MGPPKPIIEMTREQNPQVATLHVFSEGPQLNTNRGVISTFFGFQDYCLEFV